MSNEEFSVDVDEKSIDNLKKVIDNELQERSKRFNNGTETIDDLINGYRHYKICNDKGLDLDVVELKYYKRLIDFYKQAKADLYEANNRINDLLDLVKQKDKRIAVEEIQEQYFISKDKIKEILEIEEKIDNEKLLSLLQTIVDENARLEDIEDRKVQIEYNNVFNKGVKSVEDKIKAKIEEVKDGTYDAKIVLQSLLEKE